MADVDRTKAGSLYLSIVLFVLCIHCLSAAEISRGKSMIAVIVLSTSFVV